MKQALLFPGQGSQITSGKELYDNFAVARDVFLEVDSLLSRNLSTMICEGNSSELSITTNAQPALMAVSIAVLRVILQESGATISEICSLVAGHSLGEYSALCAANSLSLADTVKLLHIRSNAMATVSPAGISGMVAIIGCPIDEVNYLCQQIHGHEVCEIANDNSDDQVVVSGHLTAINKVIEMCKSLNKKAIKLNVSAGFHSKLMINVSDIMAEALEEVTILAPQIPVISNITAQATTDPIVIKNNLIAQVSGKVRWRETMQYIATQQITDIAEVGAGKVLTGLCRRNNVDAELHNVATSSDITNILKILSNNNVYSH